MNPSTDTASVFLVLALPRPWPPGAKSVLASVVVGEAKLTLNAQSDGGFQVEVTVAGKTLQPFVFQRVQFTRDPAVIACLRWDGSSAGLALNGVQLQTVDTTVSSLLTIETKSAAANPLTLLFPSAAASDLATPEEQLFIRTVGDLDRQCLTADWYEILRASACLRQLLLDGLLDHANSKHRLRPIFRISKSSTTLPVRPQAHWVNLNPELWPSAAHADLNLDAFLAVSAIWYLGQVASVRDVILACANVKGGVHFGSARTKEQEIVLKIDELVSIFGLAPSLMALRGLCRITLHAVQPLVEAILRP
jgi:hypothetical protein